MSVDLSQRCTSDILATACTYGFAILLLNMLHPAFPHQTCTAAFHILLSAGVRLYSLLLLFTIGMQYAITSLLGNKAESMSEGSLTL